MKTALAMFSVFNEMKADMADTLKKIKEIGYDGIEMFGERLWSASELRAMLDAAGLEICGWHTDISLLRGENLEETIAYFKELGCDTVVIPALGGKWDIGHKQIQECAEIWRIHAREISAIAKRLAEEEMRLGYHNHDHEFSISYGGDSVWEILLENTSPEVFMQIDTGNCIEGGGNVKSCLSKAGERLYSIHAKPYAADGAAVNIGDKADQNNWKKIIKLCKKLDVSWIAIENENEEFTDKLEMAKNDFDALSAFLNAK